MCLKREVKCKKKTREIKEQKVKCLTEMPERRTTSSLPKYNSSSQCWRNGRWVISCTFGGQRCSQNLKGKFTQKANWDMLLYTMSQFEWHRSCPSTTFRSWDMTSESSDLIISMTSLTPSLYRRAHSWIQWRHRNDVINDVIKTFRGRISRTKRHRLARPMSFESAHCVQQHISVCFLGELPL